MAANIHHRYVRQKVATRGRSDDGSGHRHCIALDLCAKEGIAVGHPLLEHQCLSPQCTGAAMSPSLKHDFFNMTGRYRGFKLLGDAISDSSDQRCFLTILNVSLPLRSTLAVGRNEAYVQHHEVHLGPMYACFRPAERSLLDLSDLSQLQPFSFE